MTLEEWLSLETLLAELQEYNYPQVKSRVENLTKILKPLIEGGKREAYRIENDIEGDADTDILKQVCRAQNLLGRVKPMNDNAYTEVGYHDKVTGDLLHALELLEDDEELVEYTKELRLTRRMRREAKDLMYVSQPLVSFIDNNGKAVKDFNKAVEEMKNFGNTKDHREYKPRAKSEMELAFEKANKNKRENDNK